MKLTKVKITNLFGIKELELDGSSLELKGANGVGKTSVIDSIRYALKNRSDRDYIIKKGENEGEIFIETNTGLTINRKPRTGRSDYKTVKDKSGAITSPESFLGSIFTELQLSPIEFISWDKNTQNRAIMDLIEYSWDMNTIKEWFGEIPEGVNYSTNILNVLYQIQDKDGNYYKKRHEINRNIRDKKANIEEIGETIPSGYNVEKWEQYSLKDIYTNIEKLRKKNEAIERAKNIVEASKKDVESLKAFKENSFNKVINNIEEEKEVVKENIRNLKEKIKEEENRLLNLDKRLENEKEKIEIEFKEREKLLKRKLEEANIWAKKDIVDFSDLKEEAKLAEDMKLHITEYKRMTRLQEEKADLELISENLTSKIEKARTLPAEILQTAKLPIDGLSVEDGNVFINGLPISNLSDGEKLELCVDLTLSKKANLKIILLDGVEKLSTKNKEKLYKKCKDKGLQFIATKTTDDSELIINKL